MRGRAVSRRRAMRRRRLSRGESTGVARAGGDDRPPCKVCRRRRVSKCLARARARALRAAKRPPAWTSHRRRGAPARVRERGATALLVGRRDRQRIAVERTARVASQGRRTPPRPPASCRQAHRACAASQSRRTPPRPATQAHAAPARVRTESARRRLQARRRTHVEATAAAATLPATGARRPRGIASLWRWARCSAEPRT